MKNAGARWTKEESDLVWNMYGSHHSIAEIAELVGRTAYAVEVHIKLRRAGPEKRAQWRKTYNENRRIKTRESEERIYNHDGAVIFRPSPEMFEDRYRRTSMPPRDLTGILMGDPPVGLSALERRT